jgi:Abnormal spindle-like microcephaly-assoc'd, ASPM-SPD-2-Hydin/Transmembrane protein 131-like N-terminal
MAQGAARGLTRDFSRKVPGAGKQSKVALVGLLAVASFGAAVGSGCAGLENTSNAAPKPLAAVQISPSAITFPNAPVGQQVTQSATLTNTGESAVSITQLAASSPEFTASGLTYPVNLGPGQSTMFKVAYRSTSVGTVSATLTAMTAHGGGSGKIKLTGGSGKASSQLALSTTALKYGNVLLNSRSTQAVTLTNSGQSDLNISQLNVTGGGFSASGLAVPATIPAGQSVALQATFAPTITGTATGSITITSEGPTASIALSGTGMSASYTMALTPSSISFGNVNVGATASQTVQLSNTGNSSVTISQVSAAGSGVSVSGISGSVTLNPSQSVPLTVTYKPAASGATAGSITVSNNDGVNAVAAVTGAGVQAGLSVTPASAAFGNVVTGVANSQTIKLTNTGNATLTVSQATVTGSGFSIGSLSVPLNIAPSQSASFNVQYAPTAAGAVSGSLSIISNASSSPATVALSGTGVTATTTLSVNPASLNFGSVSDGTAASQSFTFTNTGNSSVAVTGVSVKGTGYSILSGSGAVTLSPNQSASVSVQFAPSAAGSATGSVAIASNVSGSPSVSLSGTGVAQVSHSVGLSWGASSSTVTGYNIYRSTVSGGSYSRVNGSLLGGLSFSDSTVASGQTYYYVATAVDSSGHESAYSNEVSSTVP